MNTTAADAIDVNVSLGRWPFAHLGVESAGELLQQLDRHGIAQAWVGSLEGIFHRDLAGVNDRLALQCRAAADRLLAFGSINPTLPDWRHDVRRCHEQHGMRGVRIHPAQHGYKLDQPEFNDLLAEASGRNLILQLVVALEDERTQPAPGRAPRLDLTPLADLVNKFANLRLLVLNGFRALRPDEVDRLARAPAVWFDTATLEGVDGLGTVVNRIPPERLVLGSHWPLFHQQAALLKLRESSLPESVLARVRRQNAVDLLARGKH